MKSLYLVSIYYQKDRVTGANKRFDELGKRHLRSGRFYVTVVVAQGQKPDWCPESNVIYVRPYKSKLQRLATWLDLSFKLLCLKPGVVYSDFQPVPLLLTLRHAHYQLIHDLRNWTNFGRKGLGLFSSLFQQIQLKMAHFVVTVSEFSKADVISKCGISKDKVLVAYNGLSESYFDSGSLHNYYDYDVVYVATFEPRKNHILLIRALEHCPPDTKVVFIGRDLGSLGEIKKYIESSASACVRSIQIFDSIGEEDLLKLYRSTKTFVSPAFFEGFGMPLIEAAACRAQVLCSDIEVFKEIMGEAAIYFDPHNPQELSRHLNLVLSDKVPNKPFDPSRFHWDHICEKLEKQFEANGYV
ncbi:glycosyltransferase family 4 protein [Microbulbifer pacificus]|uniref:Glycosyltransferase family 1 protein n=1 Tax=Microbulbifer pacificus TaxID=407164 RepID=A0AAU0MY80_9GAMM|nr:glycosyltransferase family 1 protein [Microbulbifer pacificus]WOX04842.1 glycosyltransferase family 1 protein [Microbulbifer pacificus]